MKNVLSNDTKATKFSITDTKLYVPVVTLSTQHNARLLQQLKPGFKKMFSWNKYWSKVTIQAPNPYLNILIAPNFQGWDRIFVISFENKEDRKLHTKYYLPTVEKRLIMLWLMNKTFLISQLKMISEHIIVFKKLHLVK